MLPQHTRRSRRRLAAFASALLSATLAASVSNVAEAQNAEGFALNRFDVSERGSDWFVLDSLDMRGHLRPAAGAVLEWGYKPLVLYDANRDAAATIVEHQLFVHVGGSLVLWDALRVGLDLPLAAVNSGDTGATDTFAYPAPTGRPLGDLRLSATYRLAGTYGSKATVALGAQLFLPTGTASGYTGDDSVRFAPNISLAGGVGPFGAAPPFVYAARLGFMIRPNVAAGFSDATGTEIQLAASAGVQLLDRRLTVGPEVTASSVVSQSGAFFSRRATPVEVLVGAHMALPIRFLPPGFRAGVAVGPGITHGAGTPLLRIVGSLEWAPPFQDNKPKPPGDSDNDGVLDPDDACPHTPGIRSDDPSKNGCPPPKPAPGDRDGDRIIDLADACPDEAGPPNDNPKKHGCPPPADRDKDTVLDAQDACPDEPGLPSEDVKRNGCPPPKDRDKDGFLDPDDACPDQPGSASEDPKKNGCPRAVIEKGQIRILDQVKFATAKATILPESEPILEAVVKILNENPSVLKLRVEGHTDNKGSKQLNKLLSTARAASVMKWLTGHGIDKKRLTSEGLGQDRPIATNDTEEGRKENRRVEFHIVEEKK